MRRRSEPMPVKYWSFAGLMLTYWCNARCASCYLCCGPKRSERMDIGTALRLWEELIAACPHGCRVHLSGGEPFGDWDHLIELCRQAKHRGLGPLEKIETNAFWAADESVVRERLAALDAAGMGKLVISTDPYHQQYVPIERCRLTASVAGEVLGHDRLQVRWRDWLEEGFDTDTLSPPERKELFASYARQGRDRLNGRAADTLAGCSERKSPQEFADKPCREALLRSRHVHIDPEGRVMPGTCAGIVLGTAVGQSVGGIWRRLNAEHPRRPLIGALADRGPCGMLDLPETNEFEPRRGYASKCHLCWDIRGHLVRQGCFPESLVPAWMYERDDDELGA